MELSPFGGAERLGEFFAVGERVVRVGRFGNAVTRSHLDRDGERVAPGDLQGRAMLLQGEVGGLRPAIPAPGDEEPAQGEPAGEGRTEADQAAAKAAAAAARAPIRMMGRYSMAWRKSIDRVSSTACLIVASRSAGEPYRSSAGFRRRNWMVLARRSCRPGHRSSIFSAMSRSANRTKRGRRTRLVITQSPVAGHDDEKSQANEEVEVEQPVRQSGHDHQGDDRGDDPGESMKDQEPAHLSSQGGDSRLQETLAHQPLPAQTCWTSVARLLKTGKGLT